MVGAAPPHTHHNNTHAAHTCSTASHAPNTRPPSQRAPGPLAAGPARAGRRMREPHPTPTRPPVSGASPARTPRLSYRHPRVPGRPRGGEVEQRERRTADGAAAAALPAVRRCDVHPPPPPPRPRPPRPSANGRRSARSEQPPPAPAGACAPSGAADRSTRRRRAVRAPIMIAARAAARPAARKQARCRSASAACRRTDRCAQLARQACRRVRRAGGAPSGDKVPHSRREDTGEAGPSLIASACSRLTMMAPSVVHH